MTTIPTEIWEPRGDGYLHRVRRKNIGEVFGELKASLGLDGEQWGVWEYFDCPFWVNRESEWPKGQIAVFAVTGGSEGHYVHVEVLSRSNGSRQLVVPGQDLRRLGCRLGRGQAHRLAPGGVSVGIAAFVKPEDCDHEGPLPCSRCCPCDECAEIRAADAEDVRGEERPSQ